VQVIGVPDARYGEEIMAWVKVRASADVTVESIRAFCEGQIAHFKIPRYVRVTDEFPMTVTGKVQKYKMREAAIDLLGLQDAAATETA
jgi:fatty-acyl-CoA synthase